MSKYRKIDTRLWNDEKFRWFDGFTQDVWLYLLTNPHTNQLGLYVWRHEYAYADLWPKWQSFAKGLSIELIVTELTKHYNHAWQQLIQEGLIAYHEPTRMLFICHFLKYEPPASYLNIIGWYPLMKELPEGHPYWPSVRQALIKYLPLKQQASSLNAFDAYWQASNQPMLNGDVTKQTNIEYAINTSTKTPLKKQNYKRFLTSEQFEEKQYCQTNTDNIAWLSASKLK